MAREFKFAAGYVMIPNLKQVELLVREVPVKRNIAECGTAVSNWIVDGVTVLGSCLFSFVSIMRT